MRILFSKYSNWSLRNFNSDHPEHYAIRQVILKNPQYSYVLVGDGDVNGHFAIDNVHFYNMKVINKISYVFSCLVKILLGLFLRPDTIVSMGIVNSIPFGLVSYLTGSRFIPLITGELWYSIKSLHGPLKKMVELLIKFMLQNSYVILVLSESIRREIINDYGIDSKKVFVTKYKISGAFSPSASKRLRPKLNPDGPIVLTVCRISPVKGLQYLVSAAEIVTQKVPMAKFVIKGEISDLAYKKEIEQLIHSRGLDERVVMLGGSPNLEIALYMAAADVFVLPSLSEGLGVVIMEAMSSGLPVVATRVGGIVDIVSPEYNGLLVDAEDSTELAEAIIRVLSDCELRNKLVAGALDTIKRLNERESGLEGDLMRFALH